jgi:hypothetical protein
MLANDTSPTDTGRARGGTLLTLVLVLAGSLLACAPPPAETPMPPHLEPSGDMPPAGVTVGGLTYSLTATVPADSPQHVRGRLIATNTSDAALHAELPGGCMLWPIAYREGAWSAPAWDIRRLTDACTLDLAILHLAPGESSAQRLWNYSVRHLDILGDSLPPGEYRIGATIYPDRSETGYVVVAEKVVMLRP